MYVVQYDKDNTNNNYASVESVRNFLFCCFLKIKLNNQKFLKICSIMNNKTIGSYIKRLAVTNNYIMKELGDTCIDFKYMKVIQQLQNISVFSPVAYGGSKLQNTKNIYVISFHFLINLINRSTMDLSNM